MKDYSMPYRYQSRDRAETRIEKAKREIAEDLVVVMRQPFFQGLDQEAKDDYIRKYILEALDLKLICYTR